MRSSEKKLLLSLSLSSSSSSSSSFFLLETCFCWREQKLMQEEETKEARSALRDAQLEVDAISLEHKEV